MSGLHSTKLAWLPTGIAVLTFMFANAQLFRHPRTFADQEVMVVLPRFAQTWLAGGDRYLAANIAFIRALGNPASHDTHDHYAAQAVIQLDAARLNPRHEDNYYVAAAMLSWSGHVAVAEEILERASEARPRDMLPPFFLAFDYYYFDQNPELGARWMYQAAGRADEQNRYSLSRIAARWAERGKDADEALRIVRMMRSQARGGALKRYLDARILRLEGLVALQNAVRRYKQEKARPLERLDQLIAGGFMVDIPQDPLGAGYVLDDEGVPRIAQSQPAMGPSAPTPQRTK